MTQAACPPHAHPFRMIDLVLELDHGICTTVKGATTDECVRGDAASAAGYPFSLLLEAMAQAAIPLADEGEAGRRAQGASESPAGGAPAGGALVAIDEARLLDPVRYGDRLLITATLIGEFGDMIRVKARAERSDAAPGQGLVAQAEFTVALAGAS